MEKYISSPNKNIQAGNCSCVSSLWNIDQLASYLDVSKRTARSLVDRGILPVIKLGNKIQRFRKEAIDEALAKQEIKARFDRVSRGGAK
ncbi:helix-turn-helix domain-containing protein [bacterium]|nr:helix-turn-helix domain-containing protein [bacterium]